MHHRDPGLGIEDLLPAASLSELIGGPFGRWMCSNSEPQKLPPAMPHNQQAKEQPERDCRHHEQVHRGNPHQHGYEGTSSIPAREEPSSAPYIWPRWYGRHRCQACRDTSFVTATPSTVTS